MRCMSVNAPMVVAVADRAGNILAVFETSGAPTTSTGNFGQTVPADELAVALARTAAFFSNDQAPLSSRTVRFISGIHFPPGVAGTPNADLYGIENTNRGCTLSTNFLARTGVESVAINRWQPTRSGHHYRQSRYERQRPARGQSRRRTLIQGGWTPGRWRRGRGEHIAGDCGICGVLGREEFGFLPTPAQLPPPGVVIVGGIALPFVNQTTQPAGTSPGTRHRLTTSVAPTAGTLPPEGYLVGPNAGSALSQSDVNEIIMNAVLPQTQRVRSSACHPAPRQE